MKLAPMECEPAAPVITYASDALPLAFTGALPTGVPSTVNCTLPLTVWPTNDDGLTVALSVTTSLY